MRRLLPCLLLAACGGPPEDLQGKRWYAYDYAPEFGDAFTFVDPGEATPDPANHYQLFVNNGNWEMRQGPDYASGSPVDQWDFEIESDVGLTVGGFLVMPDGFVEGDTFDNGKVVSIAERKLPVGTFSEVITIELDDGPFAPEIAFVIGTGPVAISLQGMTYEVLEYETQ